MNEKTIYLLEDNVDLQMLIGDALMNDGYRVFQFNTVHAFSRSVLERLPDLFILDLNLPDGNGVTLTGQIAARPLGTVPPVLVMSADFINGRKAILNGARFFLPKPFHMDVLLSTIKRLLSF